MRNRGVSSPMPFLLIPRSLLRGGFIFRGVIGAELLEKLPELAASTGSACHAGEITLSSVLEAMQIPAELGMGAVRFSLGRYTARQDIEQAVALITRIF